MVDLVALEDETRGATLTLSLDREMTVVAKRFEIERRAPGDFSWFGSIDGDGRVVIAAKAGRLWGTIVYASSVYELKSGAGHDMRVAKIDTRTTLPAHPARIKLLQGRRSPPPMLTQQGPIAVLVAYTQEAKEACPDVELVSRNAADLLTIVASDSKADVAFHVVGIAAMPSSDHQAMSIEDTLTDFAGSGDGHYDSIHQLRDAYKADVNVLIINSDEAQGKSVTTMAYAHEAFSVVDWRYAASMFTLAHEVGHQMGLNDDDDDAAGATFPYGYGYTHESSTADQSWRTVMAKEASCPHFACPRIPRWSNAKSSVTYRNAATGDEKHDSARVLSETAGFVSRFR